MHGPGLQRLNDSFILTVKFVLSSQPWVTAKGETYEHSGFSCSFTHVLLYIILHIKHCSYPDHYCIHQCLKPKLMGAANGLCLNEQKWLKISSFFEGWLITSSRTCGVHGLLCLAWWLHSHQGNFCCCLLLSLAELRLVKGPGQSTIYTITYSPVIQFLLLWTDGTIFHWLWFWEY